MMGLLTALACGAPPSVVPVATDRSPRPPFAPASEASYVGAQVCAGCHAAESTTWARSAHAHARDVLLERSRGWDPTCLRCHVTGLGLGGWDPAHDEPLGRVTCEACHGPASGHVAAPDAAYGRLPHGPAACVACHTTDNSPDFRWGSYWAQVAHGR